MNFIKLILPLLICICLIKSLDSTLGPGDKKKRSKESVTPKPPVINIETSNDNNNNNNKNNDKEKNDKPTKIEESVLDRDLVQEEIRNVKTIYKHASKYCEPCSKQKSFNQTVLGYVTPWNSHGYDIAKQFAKKFNIISPVWLQIKRLKYKSYEFTGAHDIDKGWMMEVKKKSDDIIEFLPRILFEKLSPDDLHALFNNEEEMNALIKMLVDNANKHDFSGYVLEIYLQLHGHSKVDISHLVSDLAEALHENHNKKLILVIPPVTVKDGDGDLESNSHKFIFNSNDFDSLKDVVDGFSLMTYDHASHTNMVGPNAPYNWIRQNVEYLCKSIEHRSKILLGLNFYGMKYLYEHLQNRQMNPVEPITGSSFLDLIKTYKFEARYDKNSAEHAFYSINTPHKMLIFYPTLYSLQKRIELAESLGTGLSIWEIGQGLDYFYDLF